MQKIVIQISEKIWVLLLFFTLLFVSNDTLLFGTNKNRMFFYIHIFILALVLLTLILSKRTLSADLTVLYVSIALALATVITMVVNRDFSSNSIKYVYSIFEIVLAFFIVNRVSKADFQKCFLKIMYFLAWFSIILFLITVVMLPFTRLAPFITNENGIQYRWFIFGSIESVPLTSLYRMYGVFREPGVFAIFLLLALIMELTFDRLSEKADSKRVLILSIAVFLTFSTAAVILEFFIFAIYVFSGMTPGKANTSRILVFSLLVLLAILFYFGQDTRVFRVLFGKLFVANSSTSSRLGSFGTDYLIFKENTLTGKGWTFVENNFLHYSILAGYGKIHDTNTFLKYLAIYGVFPTALILLGSFRFFVVSQSQKLVPFFLMIFYLALLSNEDLTVNIFIYLIAFYGYQNKRDTINESFAN